MYKIYKCFENEKLSHYRFFQKLFFQKNVFFILCQQFFFKFFLNGILNLSEVFLKKIHFLNFFFKIFFSQYFFHNIFFHFLSEKSFFKNMFFGTWNTFFRIFFKSHLGSWKFFSQFTKTLLKILKKKNFFFKISFLAIFFKILFFKIFW